MLNDIYQYILQILKLKQKHVEVLRVVQLFEFINEVGLCLKNLGRLYHAMVCVYLDLALGKVLALIIKHVTLCHNLKWGAPWAIPYAHAILISAHGSLSLWTAAPPNGPDCAVHSAAEGPQGLRKG